MLPRISSRLIRPTHTIHYPLKIKAYPQLQSKMYKGPYEEKTVQPNRKYSTNTFLAPSIKKIKNIFLKGKLLWDLNNEDLSVSETCDRVLSLPNLAPQNESETAQAFLTLLCILDSSTFSEEFFYKASLSLDLESIKNPDLVYQIQMALFSHPILVNYPKRLEELFFRLFTQHLKEPQIRELSFFAIQNLHTEVTIKVLLHLQVHLIQDTDFQQKIAEGLSESMNRHSIGSLEKSTSYSTYFKKQVGAYGKDLREQLALALIRHNPNDLVECLKALHVGDEEQPNEQKNAFRRKIALEISKTNNANLAPCLRYLKVDTIQDDLFQKDIFLNILEQKRGTWTEYGWGEDLPSIFIKDVNILRECVFAVLLKKPCSIIARKLYLLNLLQLDKKSDKTLKEDMALHLLKESPFGLEKFFYALEHPETHCDSLLGFVGKIMPALDIPFIKIALTQSLYMTKFLDVAIYVRNNQKIHPHIHELFANDFSEENKKLIVKKILDYRNKALSIKLLSTFLRNDFISSGYVKDNIYERNFSALCAPKSKKETLFTAHKILPSITLAKWMAKSSKPPSEIVEFMQEYRIELRNELKPLLSSFLLSINTLDGIEPDLFFNPGNACLQLLAYVCNPKFEPKDMQAMIKKLSLLSVITSLFPSTLLHLDKNIPPLENLQNIFNQNFSAFCLFSDLSDEVLLEGYQKTFGKMDRYPNALGTYISCIPKEADKSVLKRLIYTVVKGTFNEDRYRTEDNNHLAFIKQIAPEVFEAWKSLNVEQTITPSLLNKTNKKISMCSFFEDKLAHQHWHVDGKDILPNLTSYLQNHQKPKSPGDETPSSYIEKLLIECIENEDSIFEPIWQGKLQEALTLCKQQNLELANDLKELLAHKQPSSGSLLGLFTVNWQDLFLIGTEVAGSCQRINGQYDLNKCLPTYCMDGKIGAVILQDPITKKIVARSIVRLLWNPKSQSPALFFSRIYKSHKTPPNAEDSLIMIATLCSKKISCPLFLPMQSDYTAKKAIKLEAKGSCFPHEYVDEALEFKIASMGKYFVEGYEVLPNENL